jgi:hypothetical protein
MGLSVILQLIAVWQNCHFALHYITYLKDDSRFVDGPI